jgi:hypothetical protein
MSAMTDQLTATLGVYAAQIPDTIVTVTHAYTDNGQARSQTFDAIEGEVKSNSVFKLEGKLDREVKTLLAKRTALDTYEIRPGEIVTTREGDATAKTRTIVDVAYTPASVLLTVERQYE